MSTKRASLPGADELFRTTSVVDAPPPAPVQTPSPPRETQELQERPRVDRTTQRFIDKETRRHVPKTGSGRQRHEEKVTFYCDRDELLALERARLELREHGIAADRGRIVREALSYVLADLDANGPAAILVERLGRRH